MEPHIDGTEFGYITIAGQRYEHDVVIRLDGELKKRKKKLSKAIFGTSHMISLEEAEHIYVPGARLLIIGSGQSGRVELSEQAAEYFTAQGCSVQLLPTPQAIHALNAAQEAVIAMFHITC